MKLGIKFAGVVSLTLMVPVWAVAEVNLHPHGSVKTLFLFVFVVGLASQIDSLSSFRLNFGF